MVPVFWGLHCRFKSQLGLIIMKLHDQVKVVTASVINDVLLHTSRHRSVTRNNCSTHSGPKEVRRSEHTRPHFNRSN